ncbi:MAG: hypothetical protein SOW03_00360 [Campylobacter sp.]|nr:hypothetical protein [Campylobacteraceae bacterium]MDY2634770.1 hypothetical protein [Campylobacter sp.]
MSFYFPYYPFIYCVCRGSVRGRFFGILAWTAQHLTSELLHRFPAQAAFIFTC